MPQQVSDPLNRPQPRASQPLSERHAPFSNAGVVSLLALVGVLLLSLTGLVVTSLPHLHRVTHRSLTPKATDYQDGTSLPPIYMPSNKALPLLQLAKGRSIIYEQNNKLYMVSSAGGSAQVLVTPGYTYAQAVRPVLTPGGQLLYSGNGIWLMDIVSETSTRLADLAPNQIITSMVLSNDGTTIAWTTEPINGAGNTAIYAGSLTAPTLVYEQSVEVCPCFRLFSFMNGPGQKGDETLLLTDDQASLEGVQYGLWSLDLTQPDSEPQPLLDEGSLQGPLALAPSGNTLLYAPAQGVVPNPTDGSVPVDIASLTYANSLDLATLGGQPLTLSPPQVVLPQQHDLNNNAAYHWVTTPIFAPNAQTLLYVEFSSDSQAPYDRHSALYVVQVSGSGPRLHASRPRLLVTSTSLLMELGVWLNDHVVTFYADGTLYALDIRSGAVTTILQTEAYARIIAVVDNEGIGTGP